MRVLACETSGAACSAAWYDSAARPKLREMFAPMMRGHAEHLLGQLADLYRGQNPPDRLAVGIGPGSFTGVRVGIAAMRALALAWARPLCGVGSMAALAARCARTRPRPLMPFAVLLDAGRGRCYAQAFAPEGHALSAPARCNQAEVTRLLKRHKAQSALGDGAALFAKSLPCRSSPEAPHAADIAMLAASAPAAACRTPAEPLYLQPYRVQAKLPPLHAR